MKKRSIISKSIYLSGLSCPKRLYLEVHKPELEEERDESVEALLRAGIEVGKLAHRLFPGGMLAGADEPGGFDDTEMRTERFINGSLAAPALFEAAFTLDRVRLRTDILERCGRGLSLIEVKSGTRVNEEYLDDIGFQFFVLKESGIEVNGAYILHLNSSYLYKGGSYDLDELFEKINVTDEAFSKMDMVREKLSEMKKVLLRDHTPKIDVGSQCRSGNGCPFSSFCREDLPEHHVSELPRVGAKLRKSLKAAGIKDIRNIPSGFDGLTPTQKRMCGCVKKDKAHIDPEISGILRNIEKPIHFLDLETFYTALPVYPNTRPYQIIPFQWSDHILGADSTLKHEEFLHQEDTDPREEFTSSLIKVLGKMGSIVVYSSYEETRIKALAKELQHRKDELETLLQGRIVDLLKLIRKHVYHPGFHGSFSIKAVLPALVPGSGYKDLDIQQGAMASVAYLKMIDAGTSREQKKVLSDHLFEYCKRDTEALYKLYKVLITF